MGNCTSFILPLLQITEGILGTKPPRQSESRTCNGLYICLLNQQDYDVDFYMLDYCGNSNMYYEREQLRSPFPLTRYLVTFALKCMVFGKEIKFSP